MARINALFVCSRNQWRSPTAAMVYRNDPRLSVRSCGLSNSSPRRLTATDLQWADVVFVMEAKHRTRITNSYREALNDTPLHVLNIPDDYQYMDPELMELIRDQVESYFVDRAID